jgi:hypothetical protein
VFAEIFHLSDFRYATIRTRSTIRSLRMVVTQFAYGRYAVFTASQARLRMVVWSRRQKPKTSLRARIREITIFRYVTIRLYVDIMITVDVGAATRNSAEWYRRPKARVPNARIKQRNNRENQTAEQTNELKRELLSQQSRQQTPNQSDRLITTFECCDKP